MINLIILKTFYFYKKKVGKKTRCPWVIGIELNLSLFNKPDLKLE